MQQHLRQFEQLGIRVAAISVDVPADSQRLAQKAGYTFPLLSDPKADVIRRYDVLHAGAGIGGTDVARPAEFLLDRDGVVRWRNLTEDYRVRARAEEVIERAAALSTGAPGAAARRP